MNIDIIGAGIGGLTTAIALNQKGIENRIFEQAKEIKPVGAGIILGINAMQVFEKLGLSASIVSSGNSISSLNITKPDLSLLSKVDLKSFENKFQAPTIAIHRGKLQQILVDNINPTQLILDHKLESTFENDNGYNLIFENGNKIQTSAVIGADGIHSVVREKLFPDNTIRMADQICWRAVTDFQLPLEYREELNEAWGRSERFGFVQLAENKVYWYALKSYKNDLGEYTVDSIGEYFRNYHPIIRELIKSTTIDQINTAQISDLKPNHIWYKDKVCLLGDAAHAATPNMGQGACQAIEDACVLSECLYQYELPQAFQQYQKLRIDKANDVVKRSWSIGKMAQISNPTLIRLRNLMLKSTPSSFYKKQNEKLFTLSPVCQKKTQQKSKRYITN